MTRSLILCDCSGSQKLDAETIGSACGAACSRIHTALCTTELEAAATAMENGDVVVACGQEQETFRLLAEELGVESPGFVDLRDRAGWSDEGDAAGPKMAALAAEALLPVPPTPSVDVISEGVCFVLGAADVVADLAERLNPILAVTALVTEGDLPVSRDYDVVRGRVARLTGALGGFELRLDALQMLEPGGRGAFSMTAPRDGATSRCDIILDLTGERRW